MSLKTAGLWLRDHQSFIRWIQWTVVFFYGALLIVPIVAPTPTRESHLWSDAVLFAQFVFWGIWWPCVLASIVLVGRAWCGLFCPEGMLSETASQYGRGRSIPKWIKWKGWPFVAFSCTTIYGQMVSVYQYPKPALLVLGGSTVAAVGIGLLYGRGKRVWCRYLCPVNGVFALLAKLAPFHFAVDRMAWKEWGPKMGLPPRQVNCAPLVPIKTMRGASNCHMCGRCAGFKQAIALEIRPPSDEILHVAGRETKPWETVLILFGLMGLAGGAFQWSVSPFYGMVKQALAEWLVDHGGVALLQPQLPWWILTNYPEQNDILTPLDGGVMVAYILASACLTGFGLGALLWLSVRALGAWDWPRLHHLAQCLIPFAACGVFLGLSATSVTLLRHEGVSFEFIGGVRAILLLAAGGWSVWLFWSVSGQYTRRLWRRAMASFMGILGVLFGSVHWISLFWLW